VAFGDDDPHLFTYYWVNGEGGCYNVCSTNGQQWFVPYGNGVAAGSTLPVDTSKPFGIDHYQGAWWISYNSTFVGYYPDEAWTSAGVEFTQGDYLQAFGEVATAQSKPCSAMGNGHGMADTAVSAASIKNVTLRDRSGNYVYANLTLQAKASANVNVRKDFPSTYGMRYRQDNSDPKNPRDIPYSFYYGGPSPSAC